MKFLDDNILVQPLPDGIHWEVMTPFSYAVGAPDGTTVIHVPVGFLTDFASTPRFLWSFIPPTGRYSRAVVLHDYMYTMGAIGDRIIDQKYADDVLFEACRVLAANDMLIFGAKQSEFKDWLDREVLYRGVRLGGGSTWRRYRRLDALKGGLP